MMQHKEGVIWDFDGTLFDTPAINFQIYQELAEQFEQPLFASFDVWETAKLQENGDWHKTYDGMGIPREKYAIADAYYKHRIVELAQAKLHPYEGIPDILNDLGTRSIKMGIVSGNHEEYIKDMSKQFNLRIDHTIGYTFPEQKPQPEPLWECAKLMEISTEKLIFIGDTRVDIEAGRNARIDTVVVSYGFEARDVLAEKNPQLILDTTKELHSFLMSVVE